MLIHIIVFQCLTHIPKGKLEEHRHEAIQIGFGDIRSKVAVLGSFTHQRDSRRFDLTWGWTPNNKRTCKFKRCCVSYNMVTWVYLNEQKQSMWRSNNSLASFCSRVWILRSNYMRYSQLVWVQPTSGTEPRLATMLQSYKLFEPFLRPIHHPTQVEIFINNKTIHSPPFIVDLPMVFHSFLYVYQRVIHQQKLQLSQSNNACGSSPCDHPSKKRPSEWKSLSTFLYYQYYIYIYYIYIRIIINYLHYYYQ
jgi:hypothetical protein